MPPQGRDAGKRGKGMERTQRGQVRYEFTQPPSQQQVFLTKDRQLFLSHETFPLRGRTRNPELLIEDQAHSRKVET
jgi:hypothetical protein